VGLHILGFHPFEPFVLRGDDNPCVLYIGRGTRGAVITVMALSVQCHCRDLSIKALPSCSPTRSRRIYLLRYRRCICPVQLPLRRAPLMCGLRAVAARSYLPFPASCKVASQSFQVQAPPLAPATERTTRSPHGTRIVLVCMVRHRYNTVST
jgi:hypothetical protein